jgi:pimeloyl-ACP methyl ester carboxylesterase
MLLAACASPAPEPAAPAAEATTAATEETTGTVPPQSESEANGRPQAISSTTVPCPVDLPEDDVEGETVYCGELAVPQNWDDPDGQQITLSYAVFKATDENPAPDPIIYFDGGPGTSTFGQLAGLATGAFDHLRQQHDLIFWEQRGNLYSSNLDCPDEVRDPRTTLTMEEMEAQATAQAATPQPTLDPALLEPTTIHDDPQKALEKDRTLAEFMARENDPKANCREYYEDKGVDLTQYSTASSLRDAISLMGELDYPEYNLNAISYGTTLALETMRYYDEQGDQDLPVVRSVVIDGVSPLYVDMAEQGLVMPYNVLRVFNECEADANCAEVYPDIHQRLLDMLAEIEQQPLTLGDGTEVTLDELRSLLIFASSNDAASLAYLPRLIDELERGETAVYELMQARTGAAAEEVPAGIEAIDLLTPDAKDVITCNDRSANLDVDRAFELYRSFEAPQLIADPIAVVQQLVACEAWGIMNEPAPLPEPVTSDLRTLVSNGAMDSATAVEWGEVAYKHLPNAELVVFPFAPHAASVKSDCGKPLTKAYFNDPEAEVDLTCVEKTRPIFVLLDDVLPDEIVGITK